MIETCLFDLDNTILDFNKAEREALMKTLVQFGITPTGGMIERYSQLNLEGWKLLEQNKIDRLGVKLRRFKLFFREYTMDHDPEEAAFLYENHLSNGHYFIDGARELLTALRGKYQLYIVTNGTASVQKGRIESASLKQYVDDIFISEDIGVNKPDRAFFDHCFANVSRCRRENTVIIGDSLSSDIKGGINAGIRTIWFNPSRMSNQTPIQPDHEIHQLVEIHRLLEEI